MVSDDDFFEIGDLIGKSITTNLFTRMLHVCRNMILSSSQASYRIIDLALFTANWVCNSPEICNSIYTYKLVKKSSMFYLRWIFTSKEYLCRNAFHRKSRVFCVKNRSLWRESKIESLREIVPNPLQRLLLTKNLRFALITNPRMHKYYTTYTYTVICWEKIRSR